MPPDIAQASVHPVFRLPILEFSGYRLGDTKLTAFQVSNTSSEGDASVYTLIRHPSHLDASKISSWDVSEVLLLLHGYPQCHTLWYQTLPCLPEDKIVVIPDLPGYGSSTKTPSSDHHAHSKRAIASDLVAVIDALFPASNPGIVVMGHDRGARVAYRMALDWELRVKGVCLQDIVPATHVFDRMRLETNNHEETFKSYHWIFLALPPPLPENLISADPIFYMTHTINSWAGKNSQDKFHPDAMLSWVAPYLNPSNITGALEDYRAGALVDLEHERVDGIHPNSAAEGKPVRKLKCPVLVFYSAHLAKRFEVEKVWNDLCADRVRFMEVGDEGTGHFLPVEDDMGYYVFIATWLRRDIDGK